MRHPKTALWATLFAAACIALATLPDAANAQIKLDPERIAQIAKLLPEKPTGVGRTIEDRAAWQAVGQSHKFASTVKTAEHLLTIPMPALTDDLFLDLSRTGNRSRCEKVLCEREERMVALVVAECIENRGRFLPVIEASIVDLCSEKTWLMPVHDRSLKNFRGEVVQIELRSSAVSWNLATAYYWLGDKLSADVRRLIRDELERRTLTPMESYVNSGKPRLGWPTYAHNHSAVCLAGVAGTALAVIDSPQRRAFFVAAIEHYSPNYLDSYASDGYCPDGLLYWDYGVGRYVLMAETLLQATGGKIDLLADSRMRTIAMFAPRMEIGAGVYPPFSDCTFGRRADDQVMAFLSRRFGLGLADAESRGLLLAGEPILIRFIFILGVHGFANSATACPAAKVQWQAQPRDWFDKAGVLICRPSAAGGLGAAIKGGHNAEIHNHNDLGSFVVTVGAAMPLIDPGSEIYKGRTFGKNRYQSNVINSFGHSVPRIDDKLQQTGQSAAAKIVLTDFSDDEDRLVLDLSTAYPVEGLTALQRTFVFSRAGRGSLSVTDQVELEQAKAFETALVTFSQWQRAAPNRLTIGSGDGAVSVEIDTRGKPFEIVSEEINEDLSCGKLPVRLAVRLVKPVTSATVQLTITPGEKLVP